MRFSGIKACFASHHFAILTICITIKILNLQALPVRCASAVHRPIPALIFEGKLRSQENEVRLRFLRTLVLLVFVFDGNAMLFRLGDSVFF